VPLRVNPQTLAGQSLIQRAVTARISQLLASAISLPNSGQSSLPPPSSEALSKWGIMELGNIRSIIFSP
jgi:hypothetical protein